MSGFRRNDSDIFSDIDSIAYRPRSYSLSALETKKKSIKHGNLMWKVNNTVISKPFHQKQPTVCGYHLDQEYKSFFVFRWVYSCFCGCWSRFSNCWKMAGAKLLDRIRFLKTVPGFLLIVTLSVIVANLWQNEAEHFKLAVGGSFILVSFVVIYLDYCFSSDAGYCVLVSHFWWSFLLSCLTFGRQWYRPWWYDDRDRLADMLVMTSTAIKCCCDFMDRFCKNVSYRSVFVTNFEMSTLLGFILGGILFLDMKLFLELLVIVAASAFVVINFRMKCVLAFAYLVLFITVSGISVFDNLKATLNPYALICYHLRLFFSPLIDFYFSPLSAVERWSCSFSMGRCSNYLSLLMVFLLESGFGALAFYAVFLHPEYELVFVVPVVSVSGIMWLCMHCGYFATEVVLGRKFSECQDFLRKLPTSSGSTNFAHIMSSRGVRNICLVGQQTVACALLTTVIFGAICWRREDAFYPAVLLLVGGIESCSYGRARELAVKLGGTCAAYALITPTTVVNPTSSVTILTPGSLEQQNNRATTLITALHRFFATYLIENLGCDYVTSGMTSSEAEKKLLALFGRRVKDASGARYDTYLFYFSGLTLEDGSLILGDGASLSPDHVIEMWRESCCQGNHSATDSRLLLILDIATSQPWIKTVKSLQRGYVALQTCRMTSSNTPGDVESCRTPPQPGVFTSEWVRWNCDVTSGLCADSNAWLADDGADEKGIDNYVIRPVFMTSRRWTDFALKVPTGGDDQANLAKHWAALYPGVCRPCLRLSASCGARLALVRFLGAPGRRYRRLKMRWLPPNVLDTGHGFKLVRS